MSLLSGARRRKLLAAEGLARSSVEDGQIVVRKKNTLAWRRQRSFTKQVGPWDKYVADAYFGRGGMGGWKIAGLK